MTGKKVTTAGVPPGEPGSAYRQQGSDVKLHVYDYPDWYRAIDLSPFHLGVEVFGTEYFFCGDGMQSCSPRANADFIYKETVLLGRTELFPDDMEAVFEYLGSWFNILDSGQNSQSFAIALCEQLDLPCRVPPEYLAYTDSDVSQVMPDSPDQAAVFRSFASSSGSRAPVVSQAGLSGSALSGDGVSQKLSSRLMPRGRMTAPVRSTIPGQGIYSSASAPQLLQQQGYPSSGASSLRGSLEAGTNGNRQVPPSPGSTSVTSFRPCSSIGNFDAPSSEVDALRGQIDNLKLEVETLRALHTEKLSQRDTAERSRGLAHARLSKQRSQMADAESQLLDAKKEAQKLRLQLARCQRRAAREDVEAVTSRRPSSVSSAGSRRDARSAERQRRPSPPKSSGSTSSPRRGRLRPSSSSRSPSRTPSPPRRSAGATSPLSSQDLRSFTASQRLPPPVTTRVTTVTPQVAGSMAPATPSMGARAVAAAMVHSASQSSLASGQSMPSAFPGGASSPSRQPATARSSARARTIAKCRDVDEMDELWCVALRRFPEHPDWVLIKEKRGVYRLGGPEGKKILCRITHGGLQVRVGGGWMSALTFLERQGPQHMQPRQSDDLEKARTVNDLIGDKRPDSSLVTPPSMERLLLPTKSWASRIGIRTTPDIREQRRLVVPEDAPQDPGDVSFTSSSSAVLQVPQSIPVTTVVKPVPVCTTITNPLTTTSMPVTTTSAPTPVSMRSMGIPAQGTQYVSVAAPRSW